MISTGDKLVNWHTDSCTLFWSQSTVTAHLYCSQLQHLAPQSARSMSIVRRRARGEGGGGADVWIAEYAKIKENRKYAGVQLGLAVQRQKAVTAYLKSKQFFLVQRKTGVFLPAREAAPVSVTWWPTVCNGGPTYSQYNITMPCFLVGIGSL